ncbi:nitrate reductase [Aquariibacter albus]|uniref:Molybdopterin-dependent oxidoreductase n=1 Tax=Aquariibacter albus TaxID=2759899 RepID=A0A839HU69_9BURK|nr:nitrate reductase [Aquariibacter albus]MBB1163079.1 molybdopterin-dependent oxidoreductase [Aquariibacter albus]
MRETKSTCPYCGVGCGVIITSEGDQITGVRGDPAHPANFGRLCSKGSTLHGTATAPVKLHERLRQPMQRLQRGGALTPLAWATALDTVAARFATIAATHGPDALGFYISGQLLTEDYYVFNKLAKGLLGTNNIDTNSRLCMSSAVAGYKQSLGADAPPCSYEDFDHAGCLFIAGANPAWAHPILFRRIEDARRANPLMKLIVVDPRRTDTAEEADLFLQIQPGSDVALFHAMLHVMVWEGWIDAAWIDAHTAGWDALKRQVHGMGPREAARICGVPAEAIVQAARWFAWGGADTPPAEASRRAATLSLYCQGLNQSSSGTAKNSALINLHLACAQIGRPGAGPFSLTGQPNAMGGREVGGMATLLSGHRELTNPQHRAEVAALWGVDAVPEKPGHAAMAMFEAAARGEVKALWIACTNPAQSLPDQALVREALAKCEFVVLQEAFGGTETAALADLLLPASTWGEKEGTVTNSERRISRVRAAVAAPGEAREDWRIVVDVAQRLEARLRPGRPTLFPYATPESVWNEHRETTRGRDLDITGLSWARLEAEGPQPWPCPDAAAPATARLYTDFRFATADGRARFVDTAWKPVAEGCDARHPFALTTGRLRDQWHGLSRSGTVTKLWAHAPQPVVQLHPQDLARRGLREGELAELKSRRGSLVLPVQADARIAPLQAFVAMHWGEAVLAGRDAQGRLRAGVNQLMHGKVDPQSLQPELKHAAIAIGRATLPWRLFAATWVDEADLPALRSALRAWAAAQPLARYTSLVPLAGPSQPAGGDALGARQGLRLELAAEQALPEAALDALLGLLQLKDGLLLRYADPRGGQRRLLRLAGEGAAARVAALLIAGPLVGADGKATALPAPATTARGPAAEPARRRGPSGVAAPREAGPQGEPAAVWLQRWWAERLPLGAHTRSLLAPNPAAPAEGAATPARGKQVCTCLDVAEPAIRTALAALPGTPAERLAALQGQLRCGTSCGSCLPEVRRLVQAVPCAIAQPAG